MEGSLGAVGRQEGRSRDADSGHQPLLSGEACGTLTKVLNLCGPHSRLCNNSARLAGIRAVKGTILFFFFLIFIYLFNFGCVGS